LDLHSLRRLASEGIGGLPPSALGDLADWCWDYGEATGDARYCSLWRALRPIADTFEADDAVPTESVNRFDAVLNQRLDDVLDAETAESGSMLARSMREQLFRPENGRS